MSVETWQGGGDNGTMAHYQNHHTELAPKRTLTRLIEWAQAADAAHRVAQNLVQTSFVPQQFRGKPHEATAAILAGDEVGLSPMASLKAFDIIQGSAAPKAITLRAIVQSHGHEVWQVEATDSRAVFRGKRHGSFIEHESVWTIDRARGLGLLTKENWKKQAKAMLIARATSEVCRLTAADAILGIPYSAEELADGVTPDPPLPAAQEPGTPAAAAPEARRTTQRRTKPRNAPTNQATTAATPQSAAPAAEEPQGPPLPGEDGYDDEPTQAEEMASKDQLTRLHTVFTNGGVQSKDTKLLACSVMVDRNLESSRGLTAAEARQLIDQLEQWSRSDVGLAEHIAELVGEQAPTETGGE